MASPKPWIDNDKKLKEVCEMLPQLMANGESVAEVSVAFNISRSTFYLNLDKHPELQVAYDMAKTHCEAWWQKLGRAGAAGKVKIQPQVYIANMANRFDWVNANQKVDHTSSDGSMSPKAYSQEQYADAQKTVTSKFDDLD